MSGAVYRNISTNCYFCRRSVPDSVQLHATTVATTVVTTIPKQRRLLFGSPSHSMSNLHISKYMILFFIIECCKCLLQVTIVKKDGKMMECDASFNKPASSDDKTGLPGIMPSYKHLYNALLSDSMIIDTLLNNSDDTIYFKDLDSQFILNSIAHVLQFGLHDPSELIGKSDADFYPEKFARQSRQDELLIMETGIPMINKIEQGMNAAGDVISFSTSKYPLYDRNGKIIGTWGTSRNMTKLVQAEEALAKVYAKLRTLTLIDDMTGLYNQRHFYDSLGMTLPLYTRRRMGGLSADFCLILLDIDCFKLVNDTFGHLAGDAAIRYIGGLIMAHTRSSDTAFRYGGDEYALILHDTDLAAGRELAERLRSIVERSPLHIDKTRIDLTISLGVICYNDEESSGELVQKADINLYQAKNDGRNRVC